MIIKLLYIIAIFLIVRLVINQIKKFNELETLRKKTTFKKNEDIIDAEFTVVDDDKNN